MAGVIAVRGIDGPLGKEARNEEGDQHGVRRDLGDLDVGRQPVLDDL